MRLVLIFLFIPFIHASTNRTVDKWIISRESHLSIEGKSNVNSFHCKINEYMGDDTLAFSKNMPGNRGYHIEGGMTIRVDGFRCGQKFMNDDFQKTLKTKQCPLLSIQLVNLEDVSSKITNGDVSITIAGVKKNISVQYTFNEIGHKKVQLSGVCHLLFSDFGLTPPRKLGGLIKVQEEITVRFELVLNPVSSY